MAAISEKGNKKRKTEKRMKKMVKMKKVDLHGWTSVHHLKYSQEPLSPKEKGRRVEFFKNSFKVVARLKQEQFLS